MINNYSLRPLDLCVTNADIDFDLTLGEVSNMGTVDSI